MPRERLLPQKNNLQELVDRFPNREVGLIIIHRATGMDIAYNELPSLPQDVQQHCQGVLSNVLQRMNKIQSDTIINSLGLDTDE